MAVSTASEPELTQKIRSSPDGVRAASLSASSKAPGVPPQEARDVVEFQPLALDRLRDLRPAVARRRGEEARRPVQDAPPAIVPVVHALGAGDNLQLGPEVPVRREGQPMVLQSQWPLVPGILV
jgi:hypothetical protein